MGHMRENEGSEQKKKKDREREGEERGGWRGGERERKSICLFYI